MKETQYRITFEDGRVAFCWAMGPRMAKILAQADRIRRGETYEVTDVIEVKESK